MLLHPRQFLLTSRNREVDDENLATTSFGGQSAVSSRLLEVTRVSTERSDLMLFGYIIDPLVPSATNRDILQRISEMTERTEQLFSRLQGLAGRFALFFRTDKEFIVVGDPCGGRQLFYHFEAADFIVTSSLELYWRVFGEKPITSGVKKSLLSSGEYQSTERAWFGAEAIDDRFKRLLSNHYLDLLNRRSLRIPIDSSQLPGESDTLEYVGSLLKGSLRGILNRFNVILPLTAGWDSRTSLAASKGHHSNIEFFVFAPEGADDRCPDVYIPIRLSDKLGLYFRLVRAAPPREDFLAACRAAHAEPHPSRGAQIQYLFDEYGGSNTVRVSGLAADILKSSFYGHSSSSVTADMLYSFSGYYGKSQYVKDQISMWLQDALEYCEEQSIRVQDLFYWEQRIGTWGATYAFEQDVAIEEFWPHGIRNLLLAGLRIDPSERARPSCDFYRDLITNLWKEALEEPCNPLSHFGHIFWRVRNNSLARYYKLKFFGGE